jgi:hypothetical protein
VTEDKIEFPWFTRELTADEAKAYTLFISQLCKLSKELKHASSRPIETDNEKYAFRTWLLRMAFIGPQYKPATEDPASESYRQFRLPERQQAGINTRFLLRNFVRYTPPN